MKTEKKVGHTPGSWEWRETLSGSKLYIMELEKPETRVCELSFPGTDEGRNNARLIAASPDLLEAAKELIEQIKLIGILDWRGAEGLSIENILSAIAKAEGK